MGLFNLFKGYAFFKLISIGVVFLGLGVVLTVMILLAREFAMLFCSFSFILVGSGLLFIARSIWREEKYRESTVEWYE